MTRSPFTRTDFLRLLWGPAFLAMVALVLLQELLGAATTWLVIRLARDITEAQVTVSDFAWIVASQTGSYLAGAASWIHAERCGFGTFGRLILQFARRNRQQTPLLADAVAREQTEPFLTGEGFRICFDLMYDLQFYLRLFFNLVFNALVLGLAIDAGLPGAYALALALLLLLQWQLRRPLARAYLHNQQMTNWMTARTYTAWDNIFAGNRYNFARWQGDFRTRLTSALRAQIQAILAREGWSALSGILALLIVLAATAWVAVRDAGDLALLIALAATLPRQIEMTLDMHQLTAGLTDLVAIWSRIGGLCSHLQPSPPADFAQRLDFSRLLLSDAGTTRRCATLADAVATVRAQPTGRVAVRGENGAGKSTLLVALKAALQGQAYYLPAHDRLCFDFNQPAAPTLALGPEAVDEADAEAEEAEALYADEVAREASAYSSGERQLAVLHELVAHTDHPVYLLDEWDANLDAANRARGQALIDCLAGRARVVEISHRDPAGA